MIYGKNKEILYPLLLCATLLFLNIRVCHDENVSFTELRAARRSTVRGTRVFSTGMQYEAWNALHSIEKFRGSFNVVNA